MHFTLEHQFTLLGKCDEFFYKGYHYAIAVSSGQEMMKRIKLSLTKKQRRWPLRSWSLPDDAEAEILMS